MFSGTRNTFQMREDEVDAEFSAGWCLSLQITPEQARIWIIRVTRASIVVSWIKGNDTKIEFPEYSVNEAANGSHVRENAVYVYRAHEFAEDLT